MDEVTAIQESLPAHCERILGAHGRLSTAIVGFVARQEQLQLADAIAQAIQEKTALVAEAGTGTGKTYAYLVPCLLNGQKTIISTATKTLQDQLFQKDLPTLVRALGISLRVQNLKGRANYICRYRVALHAEEGRFVHPQCAHEIQYVREKLPQLTYGERGELPEIQEDSPVWPYVTSTTENCLGTECELHATCFLVKARKRALDADVVVINHHLYFADSKLKTEGFGELLPGAQVVIFDEAHQLPELALNFHGVRFGTRQLRDLMDDLLREWPVLDLVNQPLKQLSLQLDTMIDELVASIAKREERFSWRTVQTDHQFMSAWQSLFSWLKMLAPCFESLDMKELPGLQRCQQRVDGLVQLSQQFLQDERAKVRWVERFKHSLVFHATPLEVAAEFQSHLRLGSCAYVFTSATLTMANNFDYFIRPLGLNSAKTLLLPSPFDYAQQALMYLPRGLPDPKHADYYEQLLYKALPIVQACGGRCFFLFTSHKALKYVAQRLKLMIPYPLLVQGDEAKPILLSRFRELGNAVLLGTATFWEGVDVKGEALSCVIIDKLPFASPSDPVIHGKMAYLKSQGLSGFDELSLPNAVLALKQGVGRLIRDVQDSGVLMIADPRLTARAYGRQIFSSLPKMMRTRDESKVLNFINQLALTQHESTSD